MLIEQALVAKIVSTGQIEDAISQGIRSDLFVDDDAREMFEFVSAHTRRYNVPPSLALVREEKPDFEWVLVQEPLDYLVDKFKIMAKKRLAQDVLLELAELTRDDSKNADIDLHFLEASRQLATLVPSGRVSDFIDMDKRILDYEKDRKEGKKTGIKFGFELLDGATEGIKPYEFVTVSAFSGLGKSTMLQVITFNAWAQGYTPLFISLEMEANALLRKFDAMAASLDYRKLKRLDLPEEQMENWQAKAKEIRSRGVRIPVIDSIRNCTPENVYAETVRHKPDLVVLDYIGLMRSMRAGRNTAVWQAISEITQDLKQNARTLHVPILAAAQTNRAGAKDGAALDNIGSSISIAQDSDIVIGLFADEEMKAAKRMEIRLNKNRDGHLGSCKAIWDHETMTFRQPSETELFMFRDRGRDDAVPQQGRGS